jgi:superfamily II DNA or RNA helicase
MKEYRDCGALVPAIVKSIEQPDLRKVARNKTGEYILDGKKRGIYTQSIVGNVIDRWKKYNPDARLTMLYAPGKAESVWFTEQFMKIGVPWCHVDATDAVVDGKRVKLSRKLWEEILERFKDGNIKGLSSRFKLREGVDVPAVYHCILATPIGSLASYVQTIGRVLRYSDETPDHVLVTDHGGNYLRHGSPNHDRPWDQWWGLPEHAISEMHVNGIRDKKEPEPIRCPMCEGERRSGLKCPHCGYEHEKSRRKVIMEDGKMVEVDGHLIKPRYVKREKDTEEKWKKLFWGYRRKGVSATFNQMEGYFAHLHGYHPPRDLPLMPKVLGHWYRKVCDIDLKDLSGGKP